MQNDVDGFDLSHNLDRNTLITKLGVSWFMLKK